MSSTRLLAARTGVFYDRYDIFLHISQAPTFLFFFSECELCQRCDYSRFYLQRQQPLVAVIPTVFCVGLALGVVKDKVVRSFQTV